MSKLGEELQARVKESLEAEIAFYANRGLITKEEREILSSTFTEAAMVASKTIPLSLKERSLSFPQITEDSLTDKIERVVESAMIKLGVKAAYDDSPWNGDASQWKTAEAYCSSCLIDMNTGSEPKTKDKCKLPYKKPGSGSINKGALRAMASGGRGLTALKGVPKDQIAKAANFMIRHWQAAFDKSAPANVYRMAGKTPPNGSKEAQVKFFKDKQGQWWMMGIYSNRWMDREQEIISEAAHKEYAEWVNKTGFKPQVVVYHLPHLPEGFWEKVWDRWGNNVEKLNQVVKQAYSKTSIGEVQRIVYLNGFSMSVAKIYPEKYEVVEKLASLSDVGMSHGFLVYAVSDPDDFSSLKDTVNIIEKYRSHEVSVLLRERAANYGTAPIFVEEKKVYSAKDREFILAAGVPEDVIDALDMNTKEASEVMDAILDHKELADPEAAVESPSVTPPTPETKASDMPMMDEEEDEEDDMEDEDKKKSDEKETPAAETPVTETPVAEAKETTSTEEIVSAVVKALNIEQLQTLLSDLVTNQQKMAEEIASLKAAHVAVEENVKVLAKSEDEKIAEKLTPVVNWGGVGYSASKDKEAGVVSAKDAEEIIKNGPGVGASFTGDPVVDNFWNSINKGK